MATTATHKHDILLWHIKTGKLHKRISTQEVGKPLAITFSDNGQYLVARCFKQFVVWELTTFKIVKKIQSKLIPATLVAYNATQQKLITYDDYLTFRVVNLTSDVENAIKKIQLSPQKPTIDFIRAPDNKYLYVCTTKKIICYSLPNLQQKQVIPLTNEAHFTPWYTTLSAKEQYLAYMYRKKGRQYLQIIDVQKGAINDSLMIARNSLGWISFLNNHDDLLLGFNKFHSLSQKTRFNAYVYQIQHKNQPTNHLYLSHQQQVFYPFKTSFLPKNQYLVLFQKLRDVTIIDLKNKRKVLEVGNSLKASLNNIK